jgi:glycosyltransferase involved in cell wall biosynthesis
MQGEGEQVSAPLVSCIMPTADRRRFVTQALECFRRQDYSPRELIVVDDGDDPVGDLVDGEPDVRYLRLERRRSLGAKRNLACEAARGAIIAHWDDDDWSADWRLRYQVERLLAEGADVCGLRQLMFYDQDAGKAWRYSYPATVVRPWVAGGTLCYLRTLWQRNRFADLRVGEDSRFVWSGAPKKVVALEDESFYVARIHSANTSRKRLRGQRWRPVPVDQVPRQAIGGGGARLQVVPDDQDKGGVMADQRRSDHVTVSIPYHRCRPYIRQAVQSILDQTHRILTVVVVNDGDPDPPWDLLADIHDPRLVRFDLGSNRGRYFADAVVLGATTSPYYLVQDADDWSEPDRIKRLMQKLQADRADAAFSALYSHTGGRLTPRRPSILRYPELSRPLTRLLEHRTSHVGLFRTAALRRVGGYYGGFRIGYDTLLISLLLMMGRLTYLERPLYHRLRRDESLTMSSVTGLKSAQRMEAWRQLRSMYTEALQAYQRQQAGKIGRDVLAARLRRVVNARVTAGEREVCATASARLAPLLAAAAPPARTAGPARPAVATGPRAARPALEPRALVDRRELTWGGWAIHRSTAVELVARLDDRRPRRLLEVGSGTSTVVLAAWAAARGAELVTLEHDPTCHAATRARLEGLGLAAQVDLRLAPLQPRRCPDGAAHPWYSTDLEGSFDFVFIDGPPRSHGRAGVLFAVSQQLAEGWEAWLKNGHRHHEQDCVDRWTRHLPVTAARKDLEATGITVLNGPPGDGATAASVPESLGVGILSRGRWPLMERTVEALVRHLPGVSRAGPVVALAGVAGVGEDEYPGGLTALDLLICERRDGQDPGAAAGRLARLVTRAGPIRHVLLLQEGMLAATADERALLRAAELLDRRRDLDRVQLWHRGEDAVTDIPARRAARGRTAPELGPWLLRAEDVPALFPSGRPARDRRASPRPARQADRLWPGVFRWEPGPRLVAGEGAGERRAAL